MVGLGGPPSIILADLLPFCLESPRQLVYHVKSEVAKAVIQRIFKGATQTMIENKIRRIELIVQQDKETSEGGRRPYGRRCVLVCTVWGMSAGHIGVSIAFRFIPVDLTRYNSKRAPAVSVLPRS